MEKSHTIVVSILFVSLCLAVCTLKVMESNNQVAPPDNTEKQDAPDTLRLATMTTDGAERSFLLIGNTCDWTLCYTDDRGKTLSKIKFTPSYENDFWCCYSQLSPDKRYLYVACDVMPNSVGWLCRYHIHRIDTRTLETKHIVDCAKLWATNTGFGCTVCVKELTHDVCSADMKFLLRDDYYDFQGRCVRRTTSYSDSKDNGHNIDIPEGWSVPQPVR